MEYTMILKDNTQYISYRKVTDRIFNIETKLWKSISTIRNKQYMIIPSLINSNSLISRIDDEINRE
jgi:hypothetical protein